MAQRPATKHGPPEPNRLELAASGLAGGTASVAQSWRSQSTSIRVLRAFLGLTFLYAGIQKLADPNFLHPGTHDYIGSQLQAFAEGSPIGGVLRALSHVALLTGITVAVAEIAVGVGTLLGVAP